MSAFSRLITQVLGLLLTASVGRSLTGAWGLMWTRGKLSLWWPYQSCAGTAGVLLVWWRCCWCTAGVMALLVVYCWCDDAAAGVMALLVVTAGVMVLLRVYCWCDGASGGLLLLWLLLVCWCWCATGAACVAWYVGAACAGVIVPLVCYYCWLCNWYWCACVLVLIRCSWLVCWCWCWCRWCVHLAAAGVCVGPDYMYYMFYLDMKVWRKFWYDKCIYNYWNCIFYYL